MGLIAFAPLAATADETATLRIILTGDHYLLPSQKGRGGYAKLATVVKQEKAGAEHAIFVHSGDAYSPSLLAGMLKGKQTVDMLNAVGLDMMVLGNHEWDFGMETLRERIWESKFPVLASNVVDVDGLPIDGTVRTSMLSVGPFRVGVMGLVTPETEVLSSAGTDRFSPVLETAKALAEELKSQGANLIVALAHLDVFEDQELVDSGIVDVVLSGHDHYYITWDDGNVAWMEAGENSEKVGVMDVSMTSYMKRGKKRFKWEADMRMVDTKNVAEDAAIASKVKGYEDRLSKELDIEIGSTSTELDSRRKTVRTGEAAIGNLIADAMRAGVDAEIGFANGGGIRAKKIYAPGTTLTRRDILTELPFGNVVVKLGLTGAQIWEALENGVSQAEKGAGRFPQIAGISFVWNPKAKAGSRVVSAKIGGQPLDKGRNYTVATNNYAAGGGDGYKVFKKGKVIIDASGATLLAGMVMDYIKTKGTVSPKVEGRIVAQ
ncbi:MAG: 5'-nucleotidase C-terminal domain-containing protein [SAR324 cluster bacterium]|nr:5'-nucleotidase C-terminal domain-containing protein [SAR324 cluster bacterium]MBL7034126.1 5'-nucleotidase C-terminal domain-containing protein [SAR324 cluster bacterium]